MVDFKTEQRSLEWYRARLGHFTGSRIGDLMKTGKKKDEPFGETAKTYMYQVMAERLLNDTVVDDDELFAEYVKYRNTTTRAMQWGTEQEAQARALYCKKYMPEGAKCKEVSLCYHDTVDYLAASPDALVCLNPEAPVGENTTVSLEIKCPNIDTAMRYMTEIWDGTSLKQTNPAYYWQVMAEMACTGSEYGVFIVYQPWLKTPIKAVNIGRNEGDIEMLYDRVQQANLWIALHAPKIGGKQ